MISRHLTLFALFSAVVFTGCAFSTYKTEVMSTALENAWTAEYGLGSEALYGGASESRVDVFGLALKENKTSVIVVMWRDLREDCLTGIMRRLEEGTLGPVGARVSLDLLKQFNFAISHLTGTDQ